MQECTSREVLLQVQDHLMIFTIPHNDIHNSYYYQNKPKYKYSFRTARLSSHRDYPSNKMSKSMGTSHVAPLPDIDKISVLVDNHRLQTYREESG